MPKPKRPALAGTLLLSLSASPASGQLAEHLYDYEDIDDLVCCEREGPIPSVRGLRLADTAERVDCSITPEYFRLKFETPRRPAVLTGCDEDWPAKRLWDVESLMARFGRRALARMKLSEDDGDWERSPFGFVAEAYRQGSFWHVSDDLADAEFRAIDREYEVPPQFRRDLYENFTDFPPDWIGTKKRWFIFGPKWSGTSPHIDPLATDFWNSLVRGYKWWIVWPPGLSSEDEVLCDPRCSVESPTILQWYSAFGMEAHTWEYRGENPIHILQEPGETVYCPDGLVHAVLNMEEVVAITANYASEDNLDKVWESVVEEGTEEQKRRFFNEILTEEQRRKLMGSDSLHECQSDVNCQEPGLEDF